MGWWSGHGRGELREAIPPVAQPIIDGAMGAERKTALGRVAARDAPAAEEEEEDGDEGDEKAEGKGQGRVRGRAACGVAVARV